MKLVQVSIFSILPLSLKKLVMMSADTFSSFTGQEASTEQRLKAKSLFHFLPQRLALHQPLQVTCFERIENNEQSCWSVSCYTQP